MCMLTRAVGCHPLLRMTLWSLCRNILWRIIASQLRNSAVNSRRFPASCYRKLSQSIVVQKIVCQMVPKQLTPEYKAKRMESALTFLQRYHDDGNDHQRWWNVVCTYYPRNQPALASQWISLQGEIQADFVGAESDVHGVVGQMCILLIDFYPLVRRWVLSITVKHCRNCDGPFRTSGTGCSSSAGRYSIIHPIARTSRPVISIFSYSARNSCLFSVFRMAVRE